MKPIDKLTARAVPLRAENVDTDQIIPARFLTTVSREGLAEGLFDAWRSRADFVLNQSQYEGAEILLAGVNFGSGSSREHAVWALTDYGFRVVITPGFADIFYSNSLKNGLLPVQLPEGLVNSFMEAVEQDPQITLSVDLKAQTVTGPDGQAHSFDIAPFRKDCLLQGLDDLGYLLDKEPAISAHESSKA